MGNPVSDLFPKPVHKGFAPVWPNEFADKGYIIFFTGRCGSSELVETLLQLDCCGKPGEFFNESHIPEQNAEWAHKDIGSYVLSLIESKSAGRMFGFKIDGFRHRWLRDIIDPRVLFPDSAFNHIYMNRRNILEQAYSYAHAKSSGIWHIKDQSAANDEDGLQLQTVSDAEIFREMALILDQECYLETYFLENAMEPFRIDYEAFCASRVSLFAELLGFIGIDHTTISGHLERLGGLYKKMPYDRYRDERLLEFRTKYARQVAHLMRARGRLPYHSLRNFVLAQSGIDIASKPPQKA